MRLKGKVAIVTGGSKGIGRAVVQRFATEGATVIIADIEAESAVNLVENTSGEVQFQQTDVSSQKEVEHLFKITQAAYDRLDILVNNAGVVHGPQAVRHFLEMPQEMWQLLLDVHLNGLFFCSQQAARIMAQEGTGGSIINMSSCGGTRAHRQMVAYDTTKGGIEAATRAMALDLAPWKIRVNALVPGAIEVESREPVGEEQKTHPRDVIPLARLGTPGEIADAALFLASDEASYITGTSLLVDGGLLAQLRSPAVDTKPDLSLIKRYTTG